MELSQGPSSTKKWCLNEVELAFNLEKTPSTKGLTEDPIWKLHIPKLIPLVPKGLPKEVTESIPDSIFINEKSCKPSVQKSVKVRNYIEVTRPRNCSFTYRYKPHMMLVEIHALYRNPDLLRITNTIDGSVPK